MPRDRRPSNDHEYDGDEDSGRRQPKRRRYGGFGEGRDRSFFLPQTIKRPGREPQPQRDPRNIGGMGAPRTSQRARIQPPAPSTGGGVGADLAKRSPRFRQGAADNADTVAYSEGLRSGTRDPLRAMPFQLLDFLPQEGAPPIPELADIGMGLPPSAPFGTSLDEIMIPPIPRPRFPVTGSRIPRARY